MLSRSAGSGGPGPGPRPCKHHPKPPGIDGTEPDRAGGRGPGPLPLPRSQGDRRSGGRPGRPRPASGPSGQQRRQAGLKGDAACERDSSRPARPLCAPPSAPAGIPRIGAKGMESANVVAQGRGARQAGKGPPRAPKRPCGGRGPEMSVSARAEGKARMPPGDGGRERPAGHPGIVERTRQWQLPDAPRHRPGAETALPRPVLAVELRPCPALAGRDRANAEAAGQGRAPTASPGSAGLAPAGAATGQRRVQPAAPSVGSGTGSLLSRHVTQEPCLADLPRGGTAPRHALRPCHGAPSAPRHGRGCWRSTAPRRGRYIRALRASVPVAVRARRSAAAACIASISAAFFSTSSTMWSMIRSSVT